MGDGLELSWCVDASPLSFSLPISSPPHIPPSPYAPLLQRLVEAAEEAHLQHEENPELQVRVAGGGKIRWRIEDRDSKKHDVQKRK